MFGLKPTRARNPLGPDRGEGWAGFSCGHVLSISVRDSAAMLDAIHGPEPSSPYVAPPPERPFAQEVGRDPGRLRIAFTDKSPYGDAIDPEIAAAVRGSRKPAGRARPSCRGARACAGRRSGGGDVDNRERQHRAQCAACRTALWPRHDGRRFRDIDACKRAQRAKDDARPTMSAAQLSAFQISRGLATFFETCDVFLCPTLCSPPAARSASSTRCRRICRISRPILRRYMPATAMFNMSGQPAMSVPLAWNAAGLPLGMMFAARFGDEATLFRLAAQLEQERPWKDRLPPICA